MPAVTTDDILSLSRIGAHDLASTERAVISVTTAPAGFEGEGFPVKRAFQGVDLAHLDPFIHLDQMGEVEYAPGEPKGTPWHPHRGFETVTYMIDGIMEHQDSEGGGGVITNGDTQWMTAGRAAAGAPRRVGRPVHGFQLWVNLPSAHKWLPPRYQDIRGQEVTLLTTPDGGALIRLIAGSLDGHDGPGDTHTPITMVHATISAGARMQLPWRSDFNSLAYVLNGNATFGVERRRAQSGQLVVFGAGEAITITADESQESRSPDVDVLLLGGRPIKEPVAWYGPFVMNTRDELVEAFEDYQKGAMGTVPHVSPEDEPPV